MKVLVPIVLVCLYGASIHGESNESLEALKDAETKVQTKTEEFSLLHKDVRLYLEEPDAPRIPLMVGNTGRQLIAVAQSSEDIDADMSEMAKPLERRAGVIVK